MLTGDRFFDTGESLATEWCAALADLTDFTNR
jgi:hypothetical protein